MMAKNFIELSHKYKYYRYHFLQNQNYRYVFCFNEFLYSLNVHNRKYTSFEDLSDLQELRYIIFNEITDNDIIFDIITQEIDYVLNNKSNIIKPTNKQPDLLIIGIHVDMCQSLCYMSENDKAFEYISKCLSLYLRKYNDNNNFTYQRLLMHFIGEVLCFEDIDKALQLYQEKIDECIFSQYVFSVTMLGNITVQLIKNSYFDKAWIFLEKWFEIYKITDIENVSIDDKYLLYHYMRLNTLVKEAKYEKGIIDYESFIQKMDKTHNFYPWFCLEISNCFLGLLKYTKFSKWINEGYDSYSYLPKDGEIYFKILKQKSILEYEKGNVNLAIDLSKKALNGLEAIYGKNEDYFSVLVQLSIMTESNEKMEMYWKEIVALSDEIDPYKECLMYINLASQNYNLFWKFTSNFEKLSYITSKAVELADKLDDYHLKFLSRLNHLRVLVFRYSQDKKIDYEINNLFAFFEKYFSKDNHKNDNDYYFFYYLYRLIYFNRKNDLSSFFKTETHIKEKILPHQSIKNINIYRNTCANLNLLNLDHENDFIDQQLDLLNYYQCNINNDNSMNVFLSQVIKAIPAINEIQANKRVDEIFKYISKAKYFYANYYGNYIDNPNNLHVAKTITGLQTRLKYQENISKQVVNELLRQLEQENIEYDYFLDDAYIIPNFSDVQLPKTSCYLDYYLYYELNSEKYNSDNIEDIIEGAKFCVHFVENDQSGNLSVKRLCDIDAEELVNSISNFYEGDELSYDKIIDLLLRPIIQYISKYETLYIAADSFLMNFPFDILQTERYSILENHIVINVYSIFDVMSDFKISTKRPLVMGNPKYSIDSEIFNKVPELPLTEIESRYIANLYNTRYFTGKKANKKNFLNNCNATFIHLSSHGFSDYTEVNDTSLSLISAGILLAGYNDWCYGSKKDNFDNGLITAQEISFLSMEQLDLVVLSACESGWANSDGLNLYKGLSWAFLYAGAKSCINSLFEVDEALTTIFMMIFYDYLKKYPVAKALHETKLKCMNLTLDEIKSNYIFRYVLVKNKEYYNKEYHIEYPFCESSIIYSFICTFKNPKMSNLKEI